jgi:alpha-tubulin suppressor-like RCC1 family protein
MMMRVAWLLVLGGCDFLFQIDHVDEPPVDSSTIDVIDANELTTVTEVDAGGGHTCVRIGASVRCFGAGLNGRLGYANTLSIGDNELPSSVRFVEIGANVGALATGNAHTCAVTGANAVVCWGLGTAGRLGLGGMSDIGDTETPASAGNVNVGIPMTSIVAGAAHTCALGNDKVRCWGHGQYGQLGYASVTNVGDDEEPFNFGDVNVGEQVRQIAAGAQHTCAVTNTNQVYCWGAGDGGRLGYGNTVNRGDDEQPAMYGPVPVSGEVLQVSAGVYHTCVVFQNKLVRCWGANTNFQLGLPGEPATTIFGDDEPASVAPLVNVGGDVTQIACGAFHTCALLSTGGVRCWGQNLYGQLGYGHTSAIGDNETPSAAGDINLGGVAVEITAGENHTCARLAGGTVRCWGRGEDGRLGYGNTANIGDNEAPAAAGDVPVL